ncbi:MAG: hypothetical protein AAF585_25030, partial [Verrucomicrobiota bacterium]
ESGQSIAVDGGPWSSPPPMPETKPLIPDILKPISIPKIDVKLSIIRPKRGPNYPSDSEIKTNNAVWARWFSRLESGKTHRFDMPVAQQARYELNARKSEHTAVFAIDLDKLKSAFGGITPKVRMILRNDQEKIDVRSLSSGNMKFFYADWKYLYPPQGHYSWQLVMDVPGEGPTTWVLAAQDA